MCARTNLSASVLVDGTVALWWTFPSLVSLKHYDALASIRTPSGGLSEPWSVSGLHFMSDGLPLSPFFLFTIISKGGSSCIRVHITEPDPTMFGEVVATDTTTLFRYWRIHASKAIVVYFLFCHSTCPWHSLIFPVSCLQMQFVWLGPLALL